MNFMRFFIHIQFQIVFFYELVIYNTYQGEFFCDKKIYLCYKKMSLILYVYTYNN